MVPRTFFFPLESQGVACGPRIGSLRIWASWTRGALWNPLLRYAPLNVPSPKDSRTMSGYQIQAIRSWISLKIFLTVWGLALGSLAIFLIFTYLGNFLFVFGYQNSHTILKFQTLFWRLCCPTCILALAFQDSLPRIWRVEFATRAKAGYPAIWLSCYNIDIGIAS